MLSQAPAPEVRCLLQSAADAPELAEGRAPAGLLAAEERATCESLRVPKRRRDWLLGRWTAKRLVRDYLAETGSTPLLDDIIIRADPDGAPYAALRGARLPVSLSISHSGGRAFCALADLAGTAVGADIEVVEPRPLSLAEQFFTPEELADVLARPLAERDLWMTLVWSAKEAYLKCIREGLRVDTRALAVELPAAAAPGWQPLTVRPRPDLPGAARAYRSWWRREDGAALTLGLLSG